MDTVACRHAIMLYELNVESRDHKQNITQDEANVIVNVKLKKIVLPRMVGKKNICNERRHRYFCPAKSWQTYPT